MNERTDRFAILLDGELTSTPRVARQVEGARAIAADGGMRHAATLGLAPELWVGDFDSARAALMTANAHVPRQDHPARKDLSDGEIAIGEAVAAGARSMVLCGALGGERTDHTLFHIMLAIRLARLGTDMVLTSGREEALPLLPGRTLAPGWPAGTLFSVIPFSDLSELTITGADWPLERVEVAMGSSLTLSNSATDTLTLTLGHGTAAVVAAFAL